MATVPKEQPTLRPYKFKELDFFTIYQWENSRGAALYKGLEDDLRTEDLAQNMKEIGGATDPPMVWIPSSPEYITGEWDKHWDLLKEPKYMILKAHRRFLALWHLYETDREAFDRLVPKGKIWCLVSDEQTYEKALLLKQDHAHVLGLHSQLDVLVNVRMAMQRGLSRDKIIRELWPLFDNAHGRSFQGKRKVDIARLEEQIKALPADDHKNRTVLKEEHLQELVNARTGLFQHYESILKGPAFVEAYWVNMITGGRVEVPEEYVMLESPKSLTNDQVKKLRVANKPDPKGKVDGNREQPTDAVYQLWTQLAETAAKAATEPKEDKAHFRGLTGVAEIRGGLGSEGAKSILDACLKTSGDASKPDLSDIDRNLRYVEVIKKAGANVLVTLDGTQETVSLYQAIVECGARLVREATEERQRQVKLNAAEEAVEEARQAEQRAAEAKAEAEITN